MMGTPANKDVIRYYRFLAMTILIHATPNDICVAIRSGSGGCGGVAQAGYAAA